MNAAEARKTTELLIIESNNKKIVEISNLIEQTVKNKGFSCSYYGDISEIVINHFEEEGYKIRYENCGMNEFSYLISW